MKFILFILALYVSTTLIAQTPSESRFRVGIMGGVDYGFTTGTITFIPPIPVNQFDSLFAVLPFQQNHFIRTGYSFGLSADIPLDRLGASWLSITTSFQQLSLSESTLVNGQPSTVIIDGKQTTTSTISESKTMLSFSNIHSSIMYGMNIASTSLRCNAGVLVGVLRYRNPVEQTFRKVEPMVVQDFSTITAPDNWTYDNFYTTLTNTVTASQSSSIQFGGVAGLDYTLNLSSFYIMPFVQYTMMFTSITKETPLRLNTLSAGIGVGMYL